MTKLDELKALMAAATPGRLRVECAHDLWVELRTGRGLQNRMVADCMSVEDANLHMATINALPELIAAVEALSQIDDRLAGLLSTTQVYGSLPVTQQCRSIARAALAKLGE